MAQMISRWTLSEIARCFDGWHAMVAWRQRSRSLLQRAVGRMEHIEASRAFLPWLAAAREKQQQQARQNLAAFTESCETQLSSGTVSVAALQSALEDLRQDQ